MIKAILIPVLVGSCALYARAGNVPTDVGSMVESAQDFESFSEGDQNVHRDAESGLYFWNAPDDSTLVSTTVKEEPGGNRYLDINASERPSEGLVRTLVSQPSWTNIVTNAYTTVNGDGGYYGLYCRFRTKFPLYDNDLSPEVDGQDRLVIWARKNAVDESLPGELLVTAGRFDGRLRNVVRHDYIIASTNIDEEAWHDITIRVVPDIAGGSRLLAFLIWIDGNPAVVGPDYPVADGASDASLLTAEARALIASRRLFPALTSPGRNESVALGGVAFTGLGPVDDFNFSTNAPAEWAEAPRVFKLCWDAGVTSIAYSVDPAVTNSVPASEIGRRSTVFEIPSVDTDVAVIAEYDTAGDYRQGFWGAEGSCALVTNVVGAVTNYSFTCAASRELAVGYVRSFRREIGLGGGVGAFASFADAKEQAILQGVVIVLNEDFAASRDTRDEGAIMIYAGETVTIDLNGHSITNGVGETPTIVNYGNLTIIDSQGGGKVVPYSTFAGNSNDFNQVAVQNYASKKYSPVLNIRGGVYDGFVVNSGIITNLTSGARMKGSLVVARSGDAPEYPQFISDDPDKFEFEQDLEDPTLYYSYDEPYWKPLTNAFIWCGKGADDKWSTPENWRCNAVPAAGDYAIFPAAGTNAWEADMETGVAVKDVWFAGDVILHGSNDCTNCRWTIPADGRVRGDAILAWVGKLPPDLSTLLDSRWAGTVSIRAVGNASPKLMTDLRSWGTASSKVVFGGVRGYYHMTGNLSIPYELVLVNGPDGYAWKNDAGFTGGVIEFRKLSGSGTFISPKNTIANRQIIIFRDILSYTGKLDVKGKRIVLGPGDAETLEAGSITWSNGLTIKKPTVAYDCRVAAFGVNLAVSYGDLGDTLTTYAPEPEGSVVGYESTVVSMPPFSELAELCITNPVGSVRLAAWSDDAIIVDGRRVATNELMSATSTTSIKAIKAASAGRLSFASHYSAVFTTNSDNTVSVRLALNENAIPVLGGAGDESAKISFEDGMASIIVSGAIPNLWYGLEYKSSLAEEWPEKPWIWSTVVPGDGNKVELVAPAEGAAGFYRVVVSDVDPEKEDGK